MDKGETPQETLEREIGEEWGLEMKAEKIGNPSLLTVTPIAHKPIQQSCKEHYDIWYFVPVVKDNFYPDQEKLEKEFFETRWLNPDQAKQLIIDPNTLYALKMLEKHF